MHSRGEQSGSVMDVYLAEIGRYPLLDAQEEVALAKQYERGRAAEFQLDQGSFEEEQEQEALERDARLGTEARQRLIECNLRLVVSVAKRYSSCGLPLADLIQEGNLGLLEAVERYNYRRGVRFATYAVWWIRQFARQAALEQRRLIRLPRGMSEELSKLRKVRTDLEARLQHRPTTTELAKEMDTSEHRIRTLQEWDCDILSLDTPIGERHQEKLADLIEDPDIVPVEETLAHQQVQARVQAALDRHLEPRDREVLLMRFGLREEKSRTLEEVAEEYDVSRQRIRQIERRALSQLRRSSALYELKASEVF